MLTKQISDRTIEKQKLDSLLAGREVDREKAQAELDALNRGVFVTRTADGALKMVPGARGVITNLNDNDAAEQIATQAEALTAELGREVIPVPVSVFNSQLKEELKNIADAAEPAGVNKSEAAKLRTGVRTIADSVVPMTTLVRQIAKDPEALVKGGGQLPATFNKFAQGALAAAERALGIEGARKTVEGNDAFERMRSAGVSSDIAQSRVLQVAYGIARALDPGGRLSDQDVQIAIQMVQGGAGTSETLETLLRDRLALARTSVESLLASDISGAILGTRDVSGSTSCKPIFYKAFISATCLLSPRRDV